MPIYNYKTKNKSGKVEKGSVTAPNSRDAAEVLKLKKLKVLSLKEEKTGGLFESKKIPLAEKVSLCRYMGLIIRSGLSFSEGLQLLANGTSNKVVRRVIDHVSMETQQGKTLYASFKDYEEQFGKAFMTVIKTGETAGTLAESFTYLARQFQQEKELKSKVMSALLYPFIIVGLMVVVSLVLFIFVLPQLAEVFGKMNVDLPFFTKLLFDSSLAFQEHKLVVSAVVGVLIAALVVMAKSKPGKKLFTYLMLHTPVVKRLLQDYNLVRFTQSLSALLKSSVPVTEAIELSTHTLSFVKTDKLAKEFSDKITRGVPLAQVFEEAGIFPALMVQLVTIGERTGNLETMLTDLSAFYQEEVENSLKNFVTALEPTLMIIVGLGVGAMVVSIISPIYSLVGQLQSGL